MPRFPRIHIENCLYYITLQGNHEEKIFREEKDYLMYVELLKKYKEEYGFKLFSFSLMPTELNLLIELKEGSTISLVMHGLNSSYTKYFNRRYERRGHLFQQRFKSVVVEKKPCLLNLIAYIHLKPSLYTSHLLYLYNKEPKEAAENIKRILNLESEVQEVLQAIAQDYPEKKDYADFISCVTQEELENLRKKLYRANILGSQEFTEKVKEQLKNKPQKEEGKKFLSLPTLSIFITVALVGVGVGVFYIQKNMVQRERIIYQPVLQKPEAEVLKELSDTEWTIELKVPADVASVYPQLDKITFAEGKINSKFFAERGFLASNYTLTTQDDDKLIWETMQKNPSGEMLFWRGEVEEGNMQGTLSLRQGGRPAQDFSFTSIAYKRRR